MKTPAISIIIPCYNPKFYIKQCVKSVLCQTMTDFEVIIVDDGSTDLANYRSIEQLSKKDSRLRIIRNPHQGVSLTRKDGYLQSNGEYIFFLDCDDFLPKDALKKLYDAATKTGADITIGNMVKVVDSYGLIQISKPFQNIVASKLIEKKNLLSECFGSFVSNGGDPISQVCTGRLYKGDLIRLAIIKDDKSLFSFVKNEDWLFSLALIPYISSIYLMKDIIYYYRYGGITITTSFRLRNNADYFNYRYDQFEKWNFQKGYLCTFVVFANELYEDLKNIILSDRFSQDEIVPFIREQMSSVKIVDWARKNMSQVEELPLYCKKIATEKPEDIYCWYSNALHSKRSRIKRVRKKCALACSKVLDVVYQVLH